MLMCGDVKTKLDAGDMRRGEMRHVRDGRSAYSGKRHAYMQEIGASELYGGGGGKARASGRSTLPCRGNDCDEHRDICATKAVSAAEPLKSTRHGQLTIWLPSVEQSTLLARPLGEGHLELDLHVRPVRLLGVGRGFSRTPDLGNTLCAGT